MVNAANAQRDRLVTALDQVWSAIGDRCRSLDDEGWDRSTRLPGWSVRDVVSHVIATEAMLAGRAPTAGETADALHVRNDIGRFNESGVADRRSRTGAEIIAELQAVTAERLEQLSRMSATQFEEEAWTPAGLATYGRFMQIRLFDCWVHELDLRDALGLDGYVGPPAVDVALDEVATALGYAVGKRAAAPDGSSVAVIVSGDDRRRYDVVVDGRARLSETPVLAPTATIATDLVTFAALIGGRIDPEVPLDDGRVELLGDEVLARRVATHLAFVI